MSRNNLEIVLTPYRFSTRQVVATALKASPASEETIFIIYHRNSGFRRGLSGC